MDKCPKCGAKVYGKFCSNCGEKIPEDTVSESSGTKRMQMRCQNCNGELRFDSDKSILSCPFCGSTEIIVESDEVKLQRMQNEIETERLLAQERQQKRQYQLELEKAQKELDKKKAESEARSDRAESCLTAITLFVGAIVAIACLIYVYFDNARNDANKAANNAGNASPTSYTYVADGEPDANVGSIVV